MQVEMWSLDRIKPYDKNPRINDNAVDVVAKSIQAYGMRQPIVVDSEGVIIVGYTRWKAAGKIGLAEVPVHIARDMEPEAVRAYRIADNKTAELSDWDFDLLPIELKELESIGYNEFSAIQHAMNLKLQDEAAFYAGTSRLARFGRECRATTHPSAASACCTWAAKGINTSSGSQAQHQLTANHSRY